MAQIEVETPSFGEVASAPGRFACPSCGSMLRVGAILCPACEADLWQTAHGGPAPSTHADTNEKGDAPLPAPASADRGRAQRSLIIAAVALGAKLALPSIAAGAQQLSLLWSVVGWVTTLSAVYAIHLARRVAGRIDGTADGRAITMARYGLTLGMASLAYVVSMLITSSIDQVIGSQPH